MNFLISILFASFISNIICVKGLGIDNILLASNDSKRINKLCFLMTICLLISTIIVYPLSLFVRKKGFEFVSILFYEIIIKLVCHYVNEYLNKTDKDMYLILSLNAAVLGAILYVSEASSLKEALSISFGASLAYYIVTILFISANKMIDKNKVLKRFRGMPIQFITMAIISLAFLV